MCEVFRAFRESGFNKIYSREAKFFLVCGSNIKLEVKFCMFCGQDMDLPLNKVFDEVSYACSCGCVETLANGKTDFYFNEDHGAYCLRVGDYSQTFINCFSCGGRLPLLIPEPISQEDREIVDTQLRGLTSVDQILKEVKASFWENHNVPYTSAGKTVIRDIRYEDFVSECTLIVQEFEDRTFDYFLFR